MKKSFTLLWGILITMLSFSQPPRITDGDLEPVFGNWKGTLTYIDYSNQKEVTLNANLKAEKTGSGQFALEYDFPEESGHQSRESFQINGDGTRINNMRLIKKSGSAGSGIEWTFEENGMDDNRPATIHHIFQILPGKLIITKMVRFQNEKDFFKRNEMVLTH